LSPLSVKFDSEKSSSTKKTLNLKNKKNKNNIYKNINTNNIFSPSKHFYIDSIINSPKNRQHVINQGAKNKLISEELNKKKNIILPYKKVINIINININGYNSPERGSVTSRDSKNQKVQILEKSIEDEHNTLDILRDQNAKLDVKKSTSRHLPFFTAFLKSLPEVFFIYRYDSLLPNVGNKKCTLFSIISSTISCIPLANIDADRDLLSPSEYILRTVL
jgi:hypothetical protein